VYHQNGQYRLDRELWAVWGRKELEQALTHLAGPPLSTDSGQLSW